MELLSRDDERSARGRFEAILAEHGALLRAAIARVCPTNLGIQLADVEQDARIRLWRAIESEREIGDVASYLHRIAATATIDAVRRAKSRREEQLRIEGEEEGVPATKLPPSAEPSPEMVASRREVAEKVRRAVEGLAENRRRAVKLHLQGFSNEDVARLLDWTDAKARNLIYRGLDDLRRALRADGIEW